MHLSDLVLNEIETRKGEDTSTRWELMPLEGLTRFESGGSLMSLFLSWERAAGDDPVPLGRFYSPMAAINDRNAHVRIVSVRNYEYKVIEHGAVSTEWAKAVENDHERLWLGQDLYEVKVHMRPLYQHIDQYIDGVRRRFSRLMLPIADSSWEAEDVIFADNYDIQPFVVPTIS